MRIVAGSVTAGIILLLVGPRATAATPTPDELFFARVQPLLNARCVACHGPDKRKGGLRLDSAGGLRQGGNHGAILRAGAPDASRLIRGVRHERGVAAMPPRETLTAAQVRDLVSWVRAGAPWPATTAKAPGPAAHVGNAWTDPANPIVRIFGGRRLDLWSLRTPTRPAPPPVRDVRAVRTPVDRFILARLEAKRLTLSPEAGRSSAA
jgi:mono/diheme cytochrome c family protein